VKVLFDTNIILDLLLNRQPFADDAAQLISRVEQSEITGFLCATSVTTIHYLMAKALDNKRAVAHLRQLLSLFEIAPVNRAVIEKALESGFSDYEDAVIDQAASHAGAQYIITRNIKDFKNASVPAYTPTGFIQVLAALKGETSA